MSRWFRFYDDAINDPKVLKLSDKSYRLWIGILCIASKNDGELPPFEDLAIMLRMKPEKLQPELEKLITAGLIDHDDDGLRPHNWAKRQYKSDVSTDRVKRFRNAERNVSETPPETDSEPDTKQIDVVEGEAARPPLLSDAAFEIATELGKLCGFAEPIDWPPQWAGAPMRVQTWLNTGWAREMILTACREVMGKRGNDPPSSINYFEKPIASFIAKQSAPLPQVKIIEGETINVVRDNQGAGSVVAAQRRLIAGAVNFGPRPSLVGSGAGADPVRMLPEGGCERPRHLHGGDNGDLG